MRKATIVSGLGFGDEGKGSIVDWLCRNQKGSLIVRFNGGAQAAHNVVTPAGVHHTFRQFGSGSLVPGVKTHLSRFMLVNPLALWVEAGELSVKSPLEPITIDEDALVITPYHQAANRLREIARGMARHGSCGFGIGETMADSLDYPDQALRMGDLAHPEIMLNKLEFIRHLKLDQLRDVISLTDDIEEASVLTDLHLSRTVVDFAKTFIKKIKIVSGDYLSEQLQQDSHVIFEGAQGVLLDEWYGFHPYTTWSTATNLNANTLLSEAGYDGDVNRLGLLRAYMTRHGAGPLVTEDETLIDMIPDAHNENNLWQQGFRIGHFDLVAARYALSLADDIDSLVITNLDRLMNGRHAWICCEYGHSQPQESFGGLTTTEELKRVYSPDLGYQERMTNAIMSARTNYLDPIWIGDENSMETYLSTIEERLGKRISLVSRGPTAQGKTLRTSLVRMLPSAT